MPRRADRVVPAVLLGTVLGLGACAPEPALDALTQKSVNIEVHCVADTVSFRLWPWVTRVNSTPTAGDEVEWTMRVPTGAVAEYDLVPENPSQWPYRDMVGKGKGKGRPNVPLQSGRLKKGSAGKSFKYTVQFDCLPVGATTPVRVIIDPDVVVD